MLLKHFKIQSHMPMTQHSIIFAKHIEYMNKKLSYRRETARQLRTSLSRLAHWCELPWTSHMLYNYIID